MLGCKDYKFWFCTGSQDLYGDECLAHVAEHSQIIVNALNESGLLPYEVVWKPTLITNEVIRKTFNEANTDENCAGVIVWCHTFSPAKSWILGLKEYRKPLCHLHTQFNEEIPYDTIVLILMISLSVFYTLKNHYFGKYFAFASLTLYISVFIIRIPLSFIFVKPFENNSTYGGLSRFWAFYGSGYVMTSILGLIFLFSLLYYAIFQLRDKSDNKS